jgi:hypothetical protein
MTMQFINDDFLPQMFIGGTNEFKEIKSEEHYVEEVGFTIALLGVETPARYLVVLYGIDAVSPENEGIYFFNNENEADQFYQQMVKEHYHSDDDYERVSRGDS